MNTEARLIIDKYMKYMWMEFSLAVMEKLADKLASDQENPHYYDAQYIWDKWKACDKEPSRFWSVIDSTLQQAFVDAALEHYK